MYLCMYIYTLLAALLLLKRSIMLYFLFRASAKGIEEENKHIKEDTNYNPSKLAPYHYSLSIRFSNNFQQKALLYLIITV